VPTSRFVPEPGRWRSVTFVTSRLGRSSGQTVNWLSYWIMLLVNGSTFTIDIRRRTSLPGAFAESSWSSVAAKITIMDSRPEASGIR
jgi:hypothetical protein